jgi:hypothetical protein
MNAGGQRRRRLPAYGLALLAVLGPVALVACGGDEEKPEATKPPCGLTDTRKGHLTAQTAPDALARATEGRMTVRFRQELTIGDRTASIEGTVDSSPEELHALDQTMPDDDGTTRLVVVDDKVYLSAEKPGTWWLIDPDDADDPLAAPMKAWFDRAGASASATAWTSGLLAVRYVGNERLDDGTQTELYEFDVDPRLASRAAGLTPPDELPRVVTSYVWIDDYDLIRQVRTENDDEQTLET